MPTGFPDKLFDRIMNDVKLLSFENNRFGTSRILLYEKFNKVVDGINEGASSRNLNVQCT